VKRVGTALVAGVLVALVGAVPAGATAFSSTASASQSDASATLDAPGSPHCTSTVGIFTPISFAWSKPVALTGKATGPLTYLIERRQNSGSWSTLASGLTATTYSDNPSGLGSLGTSWQYRITADYGNWTSPVSTSVTGIYTQVALVTVLSSCSP
jgi:hypothetical protein